MIQLTQHLPMSSKLMEITNCSLALLVMLGAPLQAEYGVTEPVGYDITELPGATAGAATAIPVSFFLGRQTSWQGYITAVDGNTVTLSGEPEPIFFEKTHYLAIQSEPFAGAAFRVLSVKSGNQVTVSESPKGALRVGAIVRLRPYDTLDTGVPPDTMIWGGWLAGDDPETADNLLLWDGETQTSKTFFLAPAANGSPAQWRQKGQAGNAGDTVLNYPPSFYVVHRGATPLQIFSVGHVMVVNRRWQKIWPGINVLGTPVNIGPDPTVLQNCGLYDANSSGAITAGSSPSEADSLTFFDGGQRLPSVWCSIREENPQWLATGTSEDRGSVVLPWSGALLLNHVGPPTWGHLQYNDIFGYGVPWYPGINAANAATLSGLPAKVIELALKPSVNGQMEASWKAVKGANYRLDTNTGTGWKTTGKYAAESTVMKVLLPKSSHAQVRVEQL